MQLRCKNYPNAIKVVQHQTQCACRHGWTEGRLNRNIGLGWGLQFHSISHFRVCTYDIWLQLCNFIAYAHLPNDVNDAISISKDMQQFSLPVSSQSLPLPPSPPPQQQQPSCISDYHLEIFFSFQILHWNCSRRGTRLKIHIACTLQFNDNLITLFVMLMSISITQSRWWWWCITSNVKMFGDKMLMTKTLIFNQYTKMRSLKKNPTNKLTAENRFGFWKKIVHTRKITRIDFFRLVSSPLFVESILLFGVWIWTTFSPAGLKKWKEKCEHMQLNPVVAAFLCAMCARSLLILLRVFTTLSSLVLFLAHTHTHTHVVI